MYGPRFTDEYKISKFAESVTVSRPGTGEVLYYSNKLTEANGATSVTMGEIRAGIGNPIVAVIPSDSNATVTITDVNLSLAMRAYQTGGLHGYGAPTLVCQKVEAKGETININVTGGTPVAGQGFNSVFCYVQTVGEGSTVLGDGTPYAVDTSNGNAITGFTATTGKEYLVWYWVNNATTEYTTILANFDPSVVNLRLVYPVYSNVKEDGTGTRIGSLVVVYPLLKFGGDAGVNGNQSSNATTSISGTAISYESAVVGSDCPSCGDQSAELVHYLYVPCGDSSAQIEGMYLLGGEFTVGNNASAKLPFMLIVNGYPVEPDAAKMGYATDGTLPTGTSVDANTGVVTTGATDGSFTVIASYTEGSTVVATCTATVIVS